MLWPGLLGNAGPYCGATVGAAGHFNSSVDGDFPSDYAGAKGGCNDDSWADAEDAAHGSGTAFSLEGLVDRMNRFDWTAGIVMYQRRVKALPASECSLPVYGGVNGHQTQGLIATERLCSLCPFSASPPSPLKRASGLRSLARLSLH